MPPGSHRRVLMTERRPPDARLAVARCEVDGSTPPVGPGEEPAPGRPAADQRANYNDQQHMSKRGQYDQLTSQYGEQFSKKAGLYAVDHVKADWNANALAKARSTGSSSTCPRPGFTIS